MNIDLLASSTNTYYQLIIILFSIGQLLTSLEYLYLIRKNAYCQNGYFPWHILQLDKSEVISSTKIQIFLKYIYSDPGTNILIITRIIFFAGIMIFPQKSFLYTFFLFILIIQNILFQYRNSYGGDGSDQMSMILLFSLFFGTSFFSSAFLSVACLIFIACQTCLSYISAGIAKLVSQKWRGGTAIFDIFNTGSYGNPTVAQFLSSRMAFSFILSWVVIIMECFFPFSLLLGNDILFYFFLSWGVLFHFFNALIMGLNSFFWIFIATYPSLFFVYFLLL